MFFMSNTLSRMITGIVLITAGLILSVVGVFFWVALLYGIPILVIGFFILFNRAEDKIEERKDLNKRKTKK